MYNSKLATRHKPDDLGCFCTCVVIAHVTTQLCYVQAHVHAC